MRDYILTPSERKIIKRYLETDDKLEGFRVLLFRVRSHNPKQILDDEELIRQLIVKAEKKQ